jgi:hypothetical protein
MHIVRGILRVLFYLAVGPLVGMLAGSLAIGLGTLATTGSPRDLVFGPEIFAPQNLIISYTLGLAPAFLTSIVALLLARAYAGWRHWLWIAFGGASLSMALAWIVFGTAPISEGMNPFIFSFVIAFAGGVAGFVCALLFDLVAGQFRRSA